MSKSLFYFCILFFMIKLSFQDEEIILSIKDFRSNPMAIAKREDFFRVALSIPNNCRVLSYTDFNNDK